MGEPPEQDITGCHPPQQHESNPDPRIGLPVAGNRTRPVEFKSVSALPLTMNRPPYWALPRHPIVEWRPSRRSRPVLLLMSRFGAVSIRWVGVVSPLRLYPM